MEDELTRQLKDFLKIVTFASYGWLEWSVRRTDAGRCYGQPAL